MTESGPRSLWLSHFPGRGSPAAEGWESSCCSVQGGSVRMAWSPSVSHPLNSDGLPEMAEPELTSES
jgi:hypothetical protein